MNVWAGEPVTCKAKLKGIKYKKTSKLEFVFVGEDGKDLAKVAAEVKDGEAVGKWEKAVPPTPGKEFHTVGYRLEVDGEKHDSFATTIKVWLKTLKIEAKLPDGKPAKGALMRIQQEAPAELSGHGAANLLRKIGDDGKFEFRLVYPAPVKIDWELPWVLAEAKWDKAEGPERSCKVKEMGWKARVSYPGTRDKASPHKQYVNLATERDKPHQGPKLTVDITAVPLEGNHWSSGYKPKAGDEVFLKAKFDAKNSARTPPSGGKGPGEELALTGKLDDKGKCAFEVPLNVSGADKVEISVGNSAECKDDTVHVITWRALLYELIQPKPDDLTGYTVFRGDKTAGLSDEMQATLDERLTPTGTEFKLAKAVTYAASDLPENGAYNVFDGAYFQRDAGKKIVALSGSQYTALRAAKGSSPQDKKTMQIVFGDFYGNPKDVDVTLPMTAAAAVQAIPFPNGAFRRALADGSIGVSKISWRVIEWKDGAAWKPVAAATDPGWAHRNETSVAINDANVNAWLEFVDYMNVKVKLPAASAGDPGKLLTIDGKPTKIAVSITFKATYFPNGGGWHGFINMSTRTDFKAGGLMRTMLHELGHNMGLAYASKTVDATYGRAATYEIPGIPFPDGVPTGLVYGGHGHNGTHCASGLSEALRGEANFQTGPKAADCVAAAKCIMWGSGDMAREDTPTYCEHCTEHFRATEADDLTRTWETA